MPKSELEQKILAAVRRYWKARTALYAVNPNNQGASRHVHDEVRDAKYSLYRLLKEDEDAGN
jgi:hypothetical protein